MMTTAPALKTKRLSIVPFSETHLSERYVSWLNDPDVVRYSEQRHRGHTLESCRQYWKSFEGTPNYYWALEETPKGLGHIGNVTAYVSVPNQLADVGILLGEKTIWGQGYGLEAFQAVCEYLLNDLKLRKVAAGTLSTNIGMLKIMKRLKMVDDGRRLSHYLCEGKPVDLVHMALYKKA